MERDLGHDVQLAKALAFKYHTGQMYGNLPYTAHLQQVAESVECGMMDERLIIVAWLHDILEDTKCDVGTLCDLFEDNVVTAVCAITKEVGQSQEDYLSRVKANPGARRVKMHDSLCNMKASLMRFDAKRVKKYAAVISFLVEDV